MADMQLGSSRIRVRDQVSTAFSTTSKDYQILIWQLANGETVWRFPATPPDDPPQDECINLVFTLESLQIRLDGEIIEADYRGVFDMKSVYDHYSIDRVEVSVFTGSSWQSNTFATDESTSGIPFVANPVIVYAFDPRDGNPTTLHQLLGHSDVDFKQFTTNSPIQCSFEPSAYRRGRGGLEGALIQAVSPILDVIAIDEVEHYGMKLIPFGLSTNPPHDCPIACVSFIVKQYVTFYNTRFTV
jgi:hypothetical protein